MKVLIVTDMQNDFITGSLGSDQAVAIVPAVISKINEYRENGDMIVFTQDTHGTNYRQTQEGRNLPVEHCINGTWGWEICDEIKALMDDEDLVVCKNTFGATDLGSDIEYELCYGEDLDEIELCGLCTGICVLSNGVILKSEFPELPCTVDVNATACVSVESKANALNVMRLLQFNIIGE